MGFNNTNGSANDAINGKVRNSLTPFEIFIIIAFVFLVITVIFSLNIESNDNSTLRLQRMDADELWAIVNSQDFDSIIKTKAFDRLITLEKPDKMIVRVYEMLYNPAFSSKKLIEHIEKYINENPTQILAQRITNDYSNKIMPETFWLKIKANWAKTLLPHAFANSQLLFKGINDNEYRRLSFVIDVLSLDNNSYLVEIANKYLSQSKTFRKPELTEKIADGLFGMKLNEADDVIRVAVKIMENDEISDDFAGFSSKIVNILKKFALTEDSRNRLKENLAEIETGNWIPVKNSLINWINSLDK